jgi:predicted transposase/invertase (TIGR01784 family)
MAFHNAILSEVKQPTLDSLTITPRHFTASDIKSDKSCILDIEATTNNGKVDIEMQVVNKGNIQLRLMFLLV